MVYAVDIWEEGLQFLRSRAKSGRNIELICRSAGVSRRGTAKMGQLLERKWTVYFKDPEMPSEQVRKLSQSKLQEVGEVQGISIFAPAKAIEIPSKGVGR